MTTHKKRLIALPPEVVEAFDQITDSDTRDDYIRELRNLGWTLDSIAIVCKVSRERIRQINSNKVAGEFSNAYPLPAPPLKEIKAKPIYIEPSPEILERLLELKPFAQQVRSNASRYRAEAEEYTRLLAEAHFEGGVTIYRLAKRLGVTHPAIRFRLARYGYKPSENGKSKVYNPIKQSHRAI